MTVFDVGANVGGLSLLFAHFVGPSGNVHSFEAASSTFERLTAVCEASLYKNVTLNNCAVADREGTMMLHIYDGEASGWNTLADRPLKDYGLDIKAVRAEEVATTTIDAYCGENRIEQIDVLKIDVEGAELQVLRGARRMFGTRRVRCCVFEFGATTFDMGNDPSEIANYFEEMGYRLRNVVKGDPLFPGGASARTARFSMHVAVPK